jgi:mannose-6-phosphate isomerase-like protein (cupin superfamily)
MKTILPFRPETEFHTAEGCYIVELLNSDADPGCSIARARVEPGVTTALHYLQGTIERYVILQGEGRVEIADEPPTAVKPLDVVIVPAGATQKIMNTGKADLLFLCVCTPRFKSVNYVQTERD